MSLSNEDLSIKLATMEAQMLSLVDSVSRIEASITRLILIDRTIAELCVSSLHIKETLVAANRDIDTIKTDVRSEFLLINNRINHCAKSISENKDKITFASGAVWVMTGTISILLIVGAWMFNRVDYNHELLIKSESSMRQIERDVQDVKGHQH